jgi:hypothetical protein
VKYTRQRLGFLPLRSYSCFVYTLANPLCVHTLQPNTPKAETSCGFCPTVTLLSFSSAAYVNENLTTVVSYSCGISLKSLRDKKLTVIFSIRFIFSIFCPKCYRHRRSICTIWCWHECMTFPPAISSPWTLPPLILVGHFLPDNSPNLAS